MLWLLQKVYLGRGGRAFNSFEHPLAET